MNWAAYIWLGLIIVFFMVEAACPIHLVSLWFAIGSLAAMFAAMLGGAVWLQIALFVIVSGGLLALLWPLVRKYMNPKLTKTNVDAVVGSTGLVTVAIDNLTAAGQVKLGSMEWTARSTNGQRIPEGTVVRVDKIEGVKTFVSAVEISAEV